VLLNSTGLFKWEEDIGTTQFMCGLCLRSCLAGTLDSSSFLLS
jgi:hypothetical protein